jgi:TrmH family RNA methyltransferase
MLFQTIRFICGILIVQKPYCNQMQKAETISSAANPLLKDVRRAVARGGLTSDGLCVAETFHLLEEALRSRCEVRTVLVAESAQDRIGRVRGPRLVVLPDALFQSISGTETAQGAIALVKPPAWTLANLLGGSALAMVLDGLQDPGNAGTIVRAAEAFGATGMVFLKGSVSPHNPKTLRASAGSLFRLPYVFGVEAAELRAAFEQHGVKLFAAAPAGALSIASANLTVPCGMIVGSEAHGVREALRSAARVVSIPTVGVESLNAAMAASILLYEARRQRTKA